MHDPDLKKKDLVTLNMVKDVVVADGKVSFTVVLTTPACPLKEKIRKDCEEAVQKVAGAQETEIDIRMTSSVTSLRKRCPAFAPGKKYYCYCFHGKGGGVGCRR